MEPKRVPDPQAPAVRIAIPSAELWAIRDEITQLTGCDPARFPASSPRGTGQMLAWAGRRGRATRRLARALGLPIREISVGPLGFIKPGPGQRPLSLVLHHGSAVAEAPHEQASAGLAVWRRLRLSWRNDGQDRLPVDLRGKDFVLVVASDSVASLDDVQTARLHYPGCLVAVIAESGLLPDLATRLARRRSGVIPVTGTNPHALFDAARAVFAPPGSGLGRDARLAGCVTNHEDGRSAEAIFSASFLAGPVYFDPWSRRPSSFGDVADRLAWLRDRFLENDRPTICVGVSRWKRDQVKGFLDGPVGRPSFIESVSRAVSDAQANGGRVVVWETRTPQGLEAACAAAKVPLERMEDGFLRSVGLGAAFRPGASAILDSRGIYYDPRRSSDLERILAETEFTPDLLDRARRLRERIVALRLSKYNVGQIGAVRDLPDDRPIVLVPGQVEDDASVLFGSPRVRGNRELLEAARRLNREAFIIFKPHPDVAAGLRQGRIEEAEALRLADRVVSDVSIADLLDCVDEIETMTSLTGFEALLRGKRVAVHGQPFYAGWALTLDRDPPPRRTRQLSLDALVAGALILYPRYLDPVTGLRCPPEILVDRLAEARDAAASNPAIAGRARDAYVRTRYALLGPLAQLLRRARGSIRPAPSPERNRADAPR